jgi:hypothetical protein
MSGLSHPHPQAMGIGHLHAASLTATIAVVVDRFLPSRVLGAAEAEEATPSIRPFVDPNRVA